LRVSCRATGILETSGVYKLDHERSELVGSLDSTRGSTLGPSLGETLCQALFAGFLHHKAGLRAHILFNGQHGEGFLSPGGIFVRRLHGGCKVGRELIVADLLGGNISK
jgi:hypothetical protein